MRSQSRVNGLLFWCFQCDRRTRSSYISRRERATMQLPGQLLLEPLICTLFRDPRTHSERACRDHWVCQLASTAPLICDVATDGRCGCESSAGPDTALDERAHIGHLCPESKCLPATGGRQCDGRFGTPQKCVHFDRKLGSKRDSIGT